MDYVIGFSNQSWDILNPDDRVKLSFDLREMKISELKMLYNQLTHLTSKSPVANQRKKADWIYAIKNMVNRIRLTNSND